MRKPRARLWIAVACVMSLLCLAATAAGKKASVKPTLTIGLAGAPGSMNPALDGNGQSVIIHELSYASLDVLNPNGSYSPGLATSAKYVGQGNKLFVIKLRHDARFSDGAPVTASAVKRWLSYFNTAKGPLVGNIGTLSSIKTVGKWTVQVHLKTSDPIMPMIVSGVMNWGDIASPKAVAHSTVLGTATDGAGPYVLVPSQSVAGDHYTFVPNKYYYEPAAIKFGKVVVKIIASASSMLDALKTGQIEVAFGDPTTAAAATSAGFNVGKAPVGFDSIFLLDRGGTIVKALGNQKVRQALNYAINRPAIAQALFGKYAQPTSEVTSLDGFVPKYQNYYPYNPAKAKQLLAAAGYPNGFTIKITDLNISQVDQAVASYWQAIGVNAQITTASSVADYLSDLQSGTYAATSLTYGSQPMWAFYEESMKPGGELNPYPGSDDPALDALWQAGSRNPDASTIWEQMSKEVTQQAWWVPVVAYDGLIYSSKKIGGVAETAAGFIPNPQVWYPR